MVDITQGGITVTFSGSPAIGTWRVNGHYVVGTCQVTGSNPAPTGSGATRRNGWMLNPSSLAEQGFDGRMDVGTGSHQGYNSALDASLSLPLTLNPGDCLVVSKSGNLGQDTLGGGNAEMLNEMMVIHCVAQAPAATDFRPPYAGTVRTVFKTSDIVGTLPNITAPFDPVGTGFGAFNLDAEYWLTRPQYHLRKSAEPPINRMSPRTQHEFYPANRSDYVTACAALSITNHARKLEARDRVIQDGIDIWGCIKATLSGGKNGIFTAGAGYGNGYFFPLLYAGYMLGNAEMLSYLNLKWTNHGGQWSYNYDFDGTHPWQDASGNPIDITGESVGCFLETTSFYFSPTAWAGYEYPRSRGSYPLGPPLTGTARENFGISAPNDHRRDWNKVYNACAHDICYYTGGLQSADGWGDYVWIWMPPFAGSFIVARLMGIENYYKAAAREMAYWWLADTKLWRKTRPASADPVLGDPAMEDVYVYGGMGNTFLRSLWLNHGSMGPYVADAGTPAPLPVVTTSTLTMRVTV